MPKWEARSLNFDVDAVLRGQGADPETIRMRSSRLVETTKQAMEEGRALLDPQTIYRDLKVEKLYHDRLVLEGGAILSGKLVAENLGSANSVVVILCTVGNALEDYTTEVSIKDIAYGLALDGVGSAAVEALANAACKHFENRATVEGLQSSIPISPGMIGWPVDVGQPEIFAILKSEQSSVNLNKYGLMHPRKSLSMVIGFGSTMKTTGRTCDYCAMGENCRYRDNYDTTRK